MIPVRFEPGPDHANPDDLVRVRVDYRASSRLFGGIVSTRISFRSES